MALFNSFLYVYQRKITIKPQFVTIKAPFARGKSPFFIGNHGFSPFFIAKPPGSIRIFLANFQSHGPEKCSEVFKAIDKAGDGMITEER